MGAVLAEDYSDFGTNEMNSDAAAQASYERGLTIEFIESFTEEHDLYDWPTSRVVAEKIKPMTAETRCRFTDLPEVRATGAVGPADTFGSHCWGSKFGLLVAAIADKASNKQRRIWLDIFEPRLVQKLLPESILQGSKRP